MTRAVAMLRRPVTDRRGFTLIEIVLVVLLIAITAAMVVPQLGDTEYQRLNSEARKLAVTFRLLREEALLNGRVYRLTYDLDAQRYWVTSAPDGGTSFVGVDDAFGEPVTLPDPVTFLDVQAPETLGVRRDGLSVTHFYPDGYVELTVIHLGAEDEAFTVWVFEPITGQVYVAYGYHEFDFA